MGFQDLLGLAAKPTSRAGVVQIRLPANSLLLEVLWLGMGIWLWGCGLKQGQKSDSCGSTLKLVMHLSPHSRHQGSLDNPDASAKRVPHFYGSRN